MSPLSTNPWLRKARMASPNVKEVVRTLFVALAAAGGLASAGYAYAGAPEDIGKVVASETNPNILASDILNRWEPIAEQAGARSAAWREMFGTQLQQMELPALQRLNSVAVESNGAMKSEYAKFAQAFRDEQATRFMVGDRASVRMKAQAKLASTTNDLVFTPVTPCRVVDTRITSTPISAGETHNFYFYDSYNPGGGSSVYPSQGGVSGCPGTNFFFAGAPPSVAVATITVVSPTAAGNALVWSGTNPMPLASVLNWSAGQVLADTTIVRAGGRTNSGPGGAIHDFAINYNGPSGSAQFVVDVVGYFSENLPTALQCVTLSSPAVSCLAGAACNNPVPACGIGYVQTGTFCVTGSTLLFLTDVREDRCYGQNTGATQNLIARARCCRVPGQESSF